MTESNIPHNGFVEQDAALLYERDIVSEPVYIEISYLCSINEDLASTRRIESHQYIAKSALSRAALPNYKCSFPSRKEKCRFMENGAIWPRWVGERDLEIVRMIESQMREAFVPL